MHAHIVSAHYHKCSDYSLQCTQNCIMTTKLLYSALLLLTSASLALSAVACDSAVLKLVVRVSASRFSSSITLALADSCESHSAFTRCTMNNNRSMYIINHTP
jgi:hypothetical protein